MDRLALRTTNSCRYSLGVGTIHFPQFNQSKNRILDCFTETVTIIGWHLQVQKLINRLQTLYAGYVVCSLGACTILSRLGERMQCGWSQRPCGAHSECSWVSDKGRDFYRALEDLEAHIYIPRHVLCVPNCFPSTVRVESFGRGFIFQAEPNLENQPLSFNLLPLQAHGSRQGNP
jgi:hypothetical protein